MIFDELLDECGEVLLLVIAIILAPFAIAMFISGGIALWQHSWHPILVGLGIAAIADVVLFIAFIIWINVAGRSY